MKSLSSLTDEQLIRRATKRYYAQATDAGVYVPEVSPADSYVTRSGWIVLRNTFREMARLPIQALEKKPTKRH